MLPRLRARAHGSDRADDPLPGGLGRARGTRSASGPSRRSLVRRDAARVLQVREGVLPRSTGFRPNMLHVGYRIMQDDSSLFSYTYDGNVLTIDPVSTGAPGWKEFLGRLQRVLQRPRRQAALQPVLGSDARSRCAKAFGDRIDEFEELPEALRSERPAAELVLPRALPGTLGVADSPAIADREALLRLGSPPRPRRGDGVLGARRHRPSRAGRRAACRPTSWRAYFEELFAAMPDLAYEVLSLIEQGDQVAVPLARQRALHAAVPTRASTRTARRSAPRAPI